jgi:hypothetical protein
MNPTTTLITRVLACALVAGGMIGCSAASTPADDQAGEQPASAAEAVTYQTCSFFAPSTSCYHEYVGHSYNDQWSCETSLETIAGLFGSWIRCVPEQPSGVLHAYVFSFTCPANWSFQTCANNGMP